MKCKVITNNRLLLEPGNLSGFDVEEIVFLDTLDIIEVFNHARNMIHQGYKLFTHPLSGSVKPIETPFKSIAVSVDTTTLDVESLLIMEDAILMANNFSRGEKRLDAVPAEILDDFRLIDFSLIKSGLEGINNI